MTELKTLEDIERELFSQDTGGKNALWDLKQEAIKWIKELGGITTEQENTEENAAICRWIKMFFNLPKEDLE